LAGLKAKGLGFVGAVEEIEGLAGKELEGFDAKDLRLVVDRAVHAALRRQMAAGSTAAAAAAGGLAAAGATGADRGSQPQRQQQQLAVTAADVASALAGFVPAAFWRAGQQKGQQQQEGSLQGWEDVGEHAAMLVCTMMRFFSCKESCCARIKCDKLLAAELMPQILVLTAPSSFCRGFCCSELLCSLMHAQLLDSTAGSNACACCCCCRWSGGLSDAVAALHEALVMPAKYGQLLAAAPLRLRTGELHRLPSTQLRYGLQS
jgi:hypothetical protein